MNPIDDQLNRLFQAAAKVSLGETAPPYGLETRVMAGWREAQKSGSGFWDTALLVRGFIVAAVIMAISFLPVLHNAESTTNPFAEFLQLTDSTAVASDDAP